MTSVSVNVEIELWDIDTEDLVAELKSRNESLPTPTTALLLKGWGLPDSLYEWLVRFRDGRLSLPDAQAMEEAARRLL